MICGDAIFTILISGVTDHFAAATLIKVQVDIRHRDTLRIKEVAQTKDHVRVDQTGNSSEYQLRIQLQILDLDRREYQPFLHELLDLQQRESNQENPSSP